MRAVPINESEAVFERFMDPLRSGFPLWSHTSDAATGGRAIQYWTNVKLTWLSGDGHVVCRMRRELEVELDDYDRLMVRLSMPSSARLTLRAMLGGRWETVVESAAGRDDYAEYEGAVAGLRIQALELEIVDRGHGPGSGMVAWLGLANDARRRLMLSRPSPFADGWGDLVIGDGEPVVFAPTLGLFFGEADLQNLRSRVSAGPYAALMENLRRMARSYLGSTPWRGICDEYNLGNPIYGRDRDAPLIDMLAARLCAFVGLIDGDRALLRTAVDHALAAVHCRAWVDGPIMTMPGVTHEHRAFVAYRVAVNVIYALDWAGALLTASGRQAVALALSMKGLPACLMSLMRHDYMRGCNQGTYMSYGALLIEAALAKLWPPHGGELIDVSKAAMDQTVERYFAEDGGAFEGAGYVSSTVSHAIVAYQAYARHRGVPLADVVPEKLKRTEGYFAVMTSTVAPAGSSVCVADGGRPGTIIYPDFLGSLAGLTGSPFLLSLLSAVLPEAHTKESSATPGAIFDILYGPDTLPPPSVRPPVFGLLPATGLLVSCRETPRGAVRLQLVGAPAGAGHTHEDKGSFIIEAYGEEIAMDRGQFSYNDPRCEVMSHARYHNLLIPETSSGVPARQVSPCPDATVLQGTGDERILSCSAGGSSLYPEQVRSWRREIRSDRPELFVIQDTMVMRKQGTVAFHLHSRYPWTRVEGGWETRGERAVLAVRPEWRPVAESGEEDFIDGYKKPAYHLTLRAGAAVKHELWTVLEVRRG